jgi:hypothetical protein
MIRATLYHCLPGIPKHWKNSANAIIINCYELARTLIQTCRKCAIHSLEELTRAIQDQGLRLSVQVQTGVHQTVITAKRLGLRLSVQVQTGVHQTVITAKRLSVSLVNYPSHDYTAHQATRATTKNIKVKPTDKRWLMVILLHMNLLQRAYDPNQFRGHAYVVIDATVWAGPHQQIHEHGNGLPERRPFHEEPVQAPLQPPLATPKSGMRDTKPRQGHQVPGTKQSARLLHCPRQGRGASLRPPPPWSLTVGQGYHKGKKKAKPKIKRLTSIEEDGQAYTCPVHSLTEAASEYWKADHVCMSVNEGVVISGTIYELIQDFSRYWKQLRREIGIWQEEVHVGAKWERAGAHKSVSCNYSVCVFCVFLFTGHHSPSPLGIG